MPAKKLKTVKLSTIKKNPNNPRVVRDEKFKKLLKSIEEFPKMMELRPMVINEDNIVLGGNMRLKALGELGYEEIPESWVKKASELTEEEQKRFIIADNVGFGDWDFEMLKVDFDIEELDDWGLEVPSFDELGEEPEDLTKEEQETRSIILNYTEKEHEVVKQELARIAETPEQAVWMLLSE